MSIYHIHTYLYMHIIHNNLCVRVSIHCTIYTYIVGIMYIHYIYTYIIIIIYMYTYNILTPVHIQYIILYTPRGTGWSLAG